MTCAEQLRQLVDGMLEEARKMGGPDWFIAAERKRLNGAELAGLNGHTALMRALGMARDLSEGLNATPVYLELESAVLLLWPEYDSEWRLGGQ